MSAEPKHLEPKRSRAEILQEALLLEQMGSEWTVEHVAAFCTLSVAFIYSSQCPRLRKAGDRGVSGRTMIRFNPADVRKWNADRTQLVR